jgi:hypothetical protein
MKKLYRFWICDFGFWIGGHGTALLFSLFSRRTGGRLGEEGRGDEGLGGADTATSQHHGPDRRFFWQGRQSQ